MKRLKICLLASFLTSLALSGCHSGTTSKEVVQDTARRTTLDTTVIPGTPGASGTQPRPGDTTQAHRDSLKRAANISDSSGGAAAKP